MTEQVKSTPVQYPITDAVKHALAVSKRGCDELLVESEWVQKLARSAATGVPSAVAVMVRPPWRGRPRRRAGCPASSAS